jgi:hypothetical protein
MAKASLDLQIYRPTGERASRPGVAGAVGARLLAQASRAGADE